MEDNKDFEKLERLERSVERLLAGYNALRQEKGALDEMLENKNAEIRRLTEQVALLSEERSVVHQRVSGLLSSIAEWEETKHGQNNHYKSQLHAEEEVSDADDGVSIENPQMSMMSMMSEGR